MSSPLTRRRFLAASATLAAGATLARAAETARPAAAAAGATTARPPWKIIGFTKPFARLGLDATADLVADVGWDGVELPVRVQAGQVAPDRVADDLPRYAEALRRRGKEIAIVTTEIVRLDARAERILRTTAQLGIRRYRLGFAKYVMDRPVPDTLREVGAALRDLAAFNRELGLQGSWQNHSGRDYVGGSLWDLWTILRDLDPRDLAVCFDPAHARIEGGLSWPTQTRLIAPHVSALFVKDFVWENGPQGPRVRWCPLGAGLAPIRACLDTIAGSPAFSGLLSQHHEYREIEGAEQVAHLKRDRATLRGMLA